jgi:hypothetical protein
VSPSESPSTSPSIPIPYGYFSYLAFWIGGAGAPRIPGTGTLIFPEFDLEGTGTFVAWFVATEATLLFPQFTLIGEGTFAQPAPIPNCADCITRSLLVTTYGWGTTEISTQFTFFPCGEVEQPVITPFAPLKQLPSNIRPLKKKNKKKPGDA